MTGETCLFNRCNGFPKWEYYGIATKREVTYSKLLGQKRKFQEFIEFNDMQISKAGKVDSYCIVDKRYLPSEGSNIDIFICDEEQYHITLYLEYSVHKQNIIKNCNDIISFLNFNKNAIFHLSGSFIYVKCLNRFKWVLFFGILEFLIKNLNMSIIGSQFYVPLFTKYLLMNELQLLLILQNWLKNLNVNFRKAFSQPGGRSTLGLKKVLPFEASNLESKFQNLKNMAILSKQGMKNWNTDACKSIPKPQLKRKSVDLCIGDDCLPKTKRFNSTKNVCHCKNYTWKIFIPFQNTSLLNYTSILEKCVDVPESTPVPVDHDFQNDHLQNANSTFYQNKNILTNQNLFSALNTSEKSLPIQQLDTMGESEDITDLSLEKIKENDTQSKFQQISDLQTLKEMESLPNERENFIHDDFNNFQLSALECDKEKSKNGQIYPRATTADESQNNVAGPSGEILPKSDLIDKLSVTFQTASGKSLKISEAALQAAEKIFKDISSESLDIFPQKKTQNPSQLKSDVNGKQYVGFQTASGKSLHASKAALEAAEKMFKEINVEEPDVFLEKQSQTKRKDKDCYPTINSSVDDDISKVLAEDFFEDIPFDEKDIDSKSIDDSTVLSVQKPEITKSHKIRKSLGGRRSLKPYSLKK